MSCSFLILFRFIISSAIDFSASGGFAIPQSPQSFNSTFAPPLTRSNHIVIIAPIWSGACLCRPQDTLQRCKHEFSSTDLDASLRLKHTSSPRELSR